MILSSLVNSYKNSFLFFFFWDQNLLNFIFGEEGKKEEKERKKSLEILAEIRKDYSQFC